MRPLARSPPSSLTSSRLSHVDLSFCKSCSVWRRSNPAQRPASQLQSAFQHARRYTSTMSTISLVTSINARAEIPAEYQRLYNALDRIKDVAASYVNPSRLQLAQRGLETDNTVIRVAVLGMSDQMTARRLVKALLADPLGNKSTWEAELDKQADERALLLRYGDEDDLPPRNPLLQTISVPSATLQNHNLEILISSLQLDPSDRGPSAMSDSPTDALLVPTLQTPTLFSGRHTLMTYPVHKTIIVGNGLDSCVAYGRYTAAHVDEHMERQMVKVAIDLTAPERETEQVSTGSVSAVDVDLANHAISKFRESLSNSIVFEQGWFRSGIAQLQDWLLDGLGTTPGVPKPDLANLVLSTLEDAEKNLNVEENQRLLQLRSKSVADAKKSSLLSSVTAWAENAHLELREQLDAAFAGLHWHRIAWWKLFWRVDDVTMITSEVLERRWLNNAEKDLIYIFGGMREAGVSSETGNFADSRKSLLPEGNARRVFGTPPPPTILGLTKEDRHRADDGLAPQPKLRIWPSQIPMARAHLLSKTVPTLQALSQTLVLQAYSTTGLMSALSLLTYIASPAWALEAGAVAALGVVYSLRHLQRKWETAREHWESHVRDEARRALKETEESMRTVVEEMARPKTDPSAVKDRLLAREALLEARKALDTVWRQR